MEALTVVEARRLVRKNLDELDANASAMYAVQDADKKEMDALIDQNLPEAINAVHIAAPAHLMEGEYDYGSYFVLTDVKEDGEVVFNFESEDFLRLVALRASDSKITVTDVLEESSPEGRKQLNKYVRGTYDRPRLVREQQVGDNYPVFRYYSMSQEWLDGNASRIGNASVSDGFVDDESFSEVFPIASFVLKQEYDTLNPTDNYPISHRLKQNIIDYLTGLVMVIYGDQRADGFFQRANDFK